MYDTHVPVICAAMRADPDTFKRGLRFVVLTIRQMIVRVPDQVREVDQEGVYAASLFGSKRDAYRHIEAHGDALWAEVCAAENAPDAMLVISTIPGLGIVKSAFVCQMMGFDVACLDSRNIRREGLPERAYRSDGEARKRRPAFARKARRYAAETQGRARELWDTWCTEVGTTYGRTPEAISALHLDCVVPKNKRDIPIRPTPYLGTFEDIPF